MREKKTMDVDANSAITGLLTLVVGFISYWAKRLTGRLDSVEDKVAENNKEIASMQAAEVERTKHFDDKFESISGNFKTLFRKLDDLSKSLK